MKIQFILVLSFLPLSLFANEFLTGRVVKVSDGDTIKILTEQNKQIKIRFNAIDCPEKKQDWGNKARGALSRIVAGEIVKVIKTDVDRYKRIVGNVFFKDENINKRLVSDGHCWVYRKYNKDPSMLDLEEQARNKELGLWKLPNPIPPWEFRKIQREKRKNKNK